jgi:hypothetical protein
MPPRKSDVSKATGDEGTPVKESSKAPEGVNIEVGRFLCLLLVFPSVPLVPSSPRCPRLRSPVHQLKLEQAEAC